MSDSEHEDDCYESRILKTRNRDRNEYSKNVGKLYNDVLLTTRRQCADGQTECFYISELKFLDGCDPEGELFSFFQKLYKDLQCLNADVVRKNAETVEKKSKKNEPIPVSITNFVPLENVTLVLRVYSVTQLVVFIRGPKMQEMYRYISDKYDSAKIVCSGYGDGENEFVMFNNKNVNVMTESDNVHRYAYQYFLDTNVITRNEDDEWVFGDDELGTL